MYGELCRDNEKITAVFTQHTTHHLRRPVLSKKVHCNTLKTPRLLLNKYGSHRHEQGQRPALNQTFHVIDSLCSTLLATKDIRLCNHACSIYHLLTTHGTKGLQGGNAIFLCALTNKFSIPGRGSARTIHRCYPNKGSGWV